MSLASTNQKSGSKGFFEVSKIDFKSQMNSEKKLRITDSAL